MPVSHHSAKPPYGRRWQSAVPSPAIAGHRSLSAYRSPSPRSSTSRYRATSAGGADADATETSRSGAVRHLGDLHRVALAAVQDTVGDPEALVADRVAGVPEVRCDRLVGDVLQHPRDAAVL